MKLNVSDYLNINPPEKDKHSLNLFIFSVEVLSGDRYDTFTKTKTNNIVKVNNSDELASFILDFIEESSQTKLDESDVVQAKELLATTEASNYHSPAYDYADNYDYQENYEYSEAVYGVSDLEKISQKLSNYISQQNGSFPKSFPNELPKQESVQENVPNYPENLPTIGTAETLTQSSAVGAEDVVPATDKNSKREAPSENYSIIRLFFSLLLVLLNNLWFKYIFGSDGFVYSETQSNAAYSGTYSN